MATTFEKLISLVAYDNALTERTDDFYLRAKTQPRTLGITEIAAKQPGNWASTAKTRWDNTPRPYPHKGAHPYPRKGMHPHPSKGRHPHPERPYLYETLKKTPNE